MKNIKTLLLVSLLVISLLSMSLISVNAQDNTNPITVVKETNTKSIISINIKSNVNALKTDLNTTITDRIIDTDEPNDSILQATYLTYPATGTSTKQGMLSYLGDMDIYRVDVPANHKDVVKLSNIPSNQDFDLLICDNLGNVLASSTNMGSVNEIIKFNTSNSLTLYYVVIALDGVSFDEVNPYTLEFGNRMKTGSLNAAYGTPSPLQVYQVNTISSKALIDLTNETRIPNGATITMIGFISIYSGNASFGDMTHYICQQSTGVTDSANAGANGRTYFPLMVGKLAKQVWSVWWKVGYIYRTGTMYWAPGIYVNYEYDAF